MPLASTRVCTLKTAAIITAISTRLTMFNALRITDLIIRRTGYGVPRQLDHKFRKFFAVFSATGARWTPDTPQTRGARQFVRFFGGLLGTARALLRESATGCITQRHETPRQQDRPRPPARTFPRCHAYRAGPETGARLTAGAFFAPFFRPSKHPNANKRERTHVPQDAL